MSKDHKDRQDIEALQAQARRSGLTYNEAKEWMAKTTGGYGTNIYSDTDVQTVREENTQSTEKSDKMKRDHS